MSVTAPAPLLTVDDVLQTLGISRTTLWEMRRRGEFPEAVRLGARALRWRREDIDNWLADRPTA